MAHKTEIGKEYSLRHNLRTLNWSLCFGWALVGCLSSHFQTHTESQVSTETLVRPTCSHWVVASSTFRENRHSLSFSDRQFLNHGAMPSWLLMYPAPWLETEVLIFFYHVLVNQTVHSWLHSCSLFFSDLLPFEPLLQGRSKITFSLWVKRDVLSRLAEQWNHM